jgi:hypothetical protein
MTLNKLWVIVQVFMKFTSTRNLFVKEKKLLYRILWKSNRRVRCSYSLNKTHKEHIYSYAFFSFTSWRTPKTTSVWKCNTHTSPFNTFWRAVILTFSFVDASQNFETSCCICHYNRQQLHRGLNFQFPPKRRYPHTKPEYRRLKLIIINALYFFCFSCLGNECCQKMG